MLHIGRCRMQQSKAFVCPEPRKGESQDKAFAKAAKEIVPLRDRLAHPPKGGMRGKDRRMDSGVRIKW